MWVSPAAGSNARFCSVVTVSATIAELHPQVPVRALANNELDRVIAVGGTGGEAGTPVIEADAESLAQVVREGDVKPRLDGEGRVESEPVGARGIDVSAERREMPVEVLLVADSKGGSAQAGIHHEAAFPGLGIDLLDEGS